MRVISNNLFDRYHADIVTDKAPADPKVINFSNVISIVFPVTAGVQYTVSKRIQTSRFRIGVYDSYPTVGATALSYWNRTSEDDMSYTFTAPANSQYMMCLLSSGDASDQVLSDILEDLMIEYGPIATEYEPYYAYNTPDEANGRNLFDKNDAYVAAAYPNLSTGTVESGITSDAHSIIIPVTDGIYTFSMNHPSGELDRNRFRIAVYGRFPQIGDIPLFLKDTGTRTGDIVYTSFEAPPGAAFVMIFLWSGSAYTDEIINSVIANNDLMLDKSTRLNPYEPYRTSSVPELTEMDFPEILPSGNLIQIRNRSRSQKGLTYTPNADGSVTVNGTATDTSRYVLTFDEDYIHPANGDTLSAGDYYTACSNSEGYSGIGCFYGIHRVDGTDKYGKGAFTLYAGDKMGVQIQIESGTVADDLVVYPVLMRGSPRTGEIEWDNTGDRFFETGVDRCVLYPLLHGRYLSGEAWNGITAINENSEGADATAIYADDLKYLNLMSDEELKMTVEAFDYPVGFKNCLGEIELSDGISIFQQKRSHFGLCYRTKVGNDVEGADLGYKLHLVFDCLAGPSDRSHSTINESQEPMSYSWEISTTPVPIEGYKPSADMIFDSRRFRENGLMNVLKAIEAVLYGSDDYDPTFLRPSEIYAIFISEMYIRDSDNNILLDSMDDTLCSRVFN